jgi:hypothetical protein
LLLVAYEWKIPLHEIHLMPEETHIDDKGRLKVSYWTALGFLERLYEPPPKDKNDDWTKKMLQNRNKPQLPDNRIWHSISSNV